MGGGGDKVKSPDGDSRKSSLGNPTPKFNVVKIKPSNFLGIKAGSNLNNASMIVDSSSEELSSSGSSL